jgi:hypothetical protein
MMSDKILEPTTLKLSNLLPFNCFEIQSLLYINHLYLYKKYRTKYLKLKNTFVKN